MLRSSCIFLNTNCGRFHRGCTRIPTQVYFCFQFRVFQGVLLRGVASPVRNGRTPICSGRRYSLRFYRILLKPARLVSLTISAEHCRSLMSDYEDHLFAGLYFESNLLRNVLRICQYCLDYNNQKTV